MNRGVSGTMKKTVLKGLCQTLILLIALFLLGVQILQLYDLADLTETLDESELAAILETRPEKLDELLEKAQEEKANTNPEILAAENPETDPEALPEEKTELAVKKEIAAVPESDIADSSSMSVRAIIVQMLHDNPRITGILYAGMFLLIALYQLPNILSRNGRSRKSRSVFLFNGILYLGCGIPFLVTGYSTIAVIIMNILYTVILLIETIIKLKKKHTPGYVILRILLMLLMLANDLIIPFIPFVVLAIVTLRALKEILIISFAQIRIDVLRKIIRKTYASEILLGLILLIVAFSLILSVLDEVGSFGDALWFCFATVTTIGYGDIATTSEIGRILSAILGIYGLIVVALLTSIIVNFYNEMIGAKKEDPDAPEQPRNEENENK